MLTFAFSYTPPPQIFTAPSSSSSYFKEKPKKPATLSLMWSPWLSSPSRRVNTPSTQRSNFACSSFKDIQTILKEDEEQQQQKPRIVHRKKPSVFHRIRLSAAVLRHWSSAASLYSPNPNPKPKPSPDPPPIYLPRSENRVVLYSTSLRVVRKTFDDCRAVRSILRGFRVSIDERDLVMDARFLDELHRILGRKVRNLSLPRVFIGGRYVGGADEIVRLHESGELKEFMQRLPLAVAGAACDTCGGHRFVLCEVCSGSNKVYDEKIGFRICTDCNENGLIRCPSCVSDYIL